MKRIHTGLMLGCPVPDITPDLIAGRLDHRPWTLPRRARKPRNPRRGILRPMGQAGEMRPWEGMPEPSGDVPFDPAPSPGPRFLETTPGPDREPATTQRTMFD